VVLSGLLLGAVLFVLETSTATSTKATAQSAGPRNKYGSKREPLEIEDDSQDGGYSHPHLNLRSSSSLSTDSNITAAPATSNGNSDWFDVIVIGSGLAGLSTTLEILDRGGRVLLLEKEGSLGGNSVKASSGINGCCSLSSTQASFTNATDSLVSFEQDTAKSAGILQPSIQNETSSTPLIHTLVTHSEDALQWLQQRVGVDLSQVAQLGGHSRPRTHRPNVGMVGAEIMANMENLVHTYTSYEKGEGMASIYTHTNVIKLLPTTTATTKKSLSGVTGVMVQDTRTNFTRSFYASQIVLATGGFASDRSNTSILSQMRPDLLNFPTTGGSFSTGDGINLAVSLHASTIDMDKVQLHPTGFIDPQRPNAGTKTLAAELLRGVGGILLNPLGKRFCNELGTRDYVTDKMLQQQPNYTTSTPQFLLVLTEDAANAARHHVDRYTLNGLMTKVKGIEKLAAVIAFSASRPAKAKTTSAMMLQTLLQTFRDYQAGKEAGRDGFGKTDFQGWPLRDNDNWKNATFYVGTVTPSLHYCMGGVRIDTKGQVLDAEEKEIPGLFAVGEVTGGVHQKNRLGGNSLLECTVFGRIIAQQLKLQSGRIDKYLSEIPKSHLPSVTTASHDDQLNNLPSVSYNTLQQHATVDNMWMAIHGNVYNVTGFAKQHPGGATILESLAGRDATAEFDLVHSQQLLQRFHNDPVQSLVIGRLDAAFTIEQPNPLRVISMTEVQTHSTPEDCWVVLHGFVYDLTDFAGSHKGGAYLIQKYAGNDATDTFKAFHKKEKLALVAKYQLGVLTKE